MLCRKNLPPLYIVLNIENRIVLSSIAIEASFITLVAIEEEAERVRALKTCGKISDIYISSVECLEAIREKSRVDLHQ